MVTAEMAVALPSLLVILVLAVCLLGAVGASLRCQQAARDGARAAARGDTASSVLAIVGAQAPPGATASVSESGGYVRVIVASPVRLPGWWQPLARWHVSGSATAAAEGTG